MPKKDQEPKEDPLARAIRDAVHRVPIANPATDPDATAQERLDALAKQRREQAPA